MEYSRHNQTLAKYKSQHRKPNTSNTNSTSKSKSKAENGSKAAEQSAGHKTQHSAHKPQQPLQPHRTNRATFLRERMVRMNYNIGSAGANMNNLPDELMLLIFGYLRANDLLLASCVCQRWKTLATDNVLWKKIYQRHASSSKPGTKKKQPVKKSPNKPQDLGYWKGLLVKECSSNRNTSVLTLLKKIDRFTGLPAKTQQALERASIRWQLCFVDTDGGEHTVTHSDVFYHKMAVHIRWYSIDVPQLYKVRRLRIYCGNPVFYDEKGRAVPNSPCQRSLMFEATFNWSQWKSAHSPNASDDLIDTYIMPDGIMIATWKSGGDFAFVTACFHADDLVERCVLGTSDKPYQPKPHRPMRDDIDPKYGLHGYTATLELRNQRTSFWSEQFRNLYCKEGAVGEGFAKFLLIDPDNSYDRSAVAKKIQMPWKTDAIKGILQNVCYLDVTILDDQNKPMCCSSSAVTASQSQNTKTDYDFTGDNYHISYSDNKGSMDMILVWDTDDKQYYMTSLQMKLALQFINYWCGTRY